MKIPRNKRYDYIIEPKDVDLAGRATMVSIFDYMMRTSHLDSQRHKLGVYQIRKQNLAWVISRAVVEVNTVLRDMDPFKVVTWVSECNRIACVRNFLMLNAEGKEIGHAVTQWSMIDFTTREAVNLLKLPRIIRHLHPEYPTCGLYPKKLHPLENPDRAIRNEHKVVYSDLDFNGHVNSLKYIQWMLDQMPIEWASNHQLWRFDVNYIHEMHWGENPYILTQLEGDTTFFEICGGDGRVACRARMEWRDF
ncbi:MAG: hypothetical protein J5873_04935 [Bacteroidales bacterium]|nr:hypothetical protein [Bacteroidales bacterium]